MTQQRPASVPVEATFVSEENEWGLGPVDAAGKRTGAWKWWRVDGSLSEESSFVAGLLDGDKTRYTEDGAVLLREKNAKNWTLWRKCFRPQKPTKEAHPFGQLHDDAVEIEFTFAEDGWIRNQTIRNSKGDVIAPDAVVAPPRPASVPETATFYSVAESHSQFLSANSVQPGVRRSAITVNPAYTYWEVGEWNFNDGTQTYRGLTTQYAPDGKLTMASYSYGGETHAYLRPDSIQSDPIIEAAEHDDRVAVATLIERGGYMTTSRLHAELLGLSELARALSKAPPPAIEYSKAQKRSADVPADATWVPALRLFAKADIHDHQVRGRADLWDRRGNHEVWTYHDGARATVERQDDDVRIEEHYVTSGAKRGTLKLKRKVDAEGNSSETESTPDGLEHERSFTAERRARGERSSRDGKLLEERWWVNDVLVATITPDPESDNKREIFRGTAPDGSEVSGRITAGFDGVPRGSWSVRKNGQELGTADFDSIRHGFGSTVAKDRVPALAVELCKLAKADAPKNIQDILALDWSEHGGWFSPSRGVGNAFYVRALAWDDEVLFDIAMTHLENDVLHQSTISQSTAPVLTAMFRLLPKLPPPRAQRVVAFLCDCFAECSEELASHASVDGSLFEVYVNGHATLAKVVAGAEGHPAHEHMVATVAEIGGSTRANVVSRFEAARDAGERCQILTEAHTNPLVTVDDFVAFMKDDDPLTRTVAAYFASLRFQAKAPPSAVDFMLAGVESLEALTPRFAELAISSTALVVCLARGLRYAALSGLDPVRPRAAVPALAAHVASLDEESLPYFVHELHSLCFGSCELPFAPPFLTWLNAIANEKLLAGPYAAEVAERCEAFGLPPDHDGLLALLATLKDAAKPDQHLRDFMHRGNAESDDDDADDDSDDEASESEDDEAEYDDTDDDVSDDDDDDA